MTRQEAAEHLRVTTKTIDRWVRDGKLTRYTISGLRSVRFKTSELDGLLEPEGAPVQAEQEAPDRSAWLRTPPTEQNPHCPGPYASCPPQNPDIDPNEHVICEHLWCDKCRMWVSHYGGDRYECGH